jgi:hypothetical protein
MVTTSSRTDGPERATLHQQAGYTTASDFDRGVTAFFTDDREESIYSLLVLAFSKLTFLSGDRVRPLHAHEYGRPSFSAAPSVARSALVAMISVG